MFTGTGYCTNHVVLPVAFGEGESLEVRDQLTIMLKTLGDDKEYQFVMALGENSKAPSTDQLDQWQRSSTPLTVLASSTRAVPFAHDTTTKDKDGNAKRYAHAGRKVAVGKIQVEIDALITFTAYDIQPAGQLDLLKAGQEAHGAYLVQQAEYRKRSNAAKIEKAQAAVEEKRRAAGKKVS